MHNIGYQHFTNILLHTTPYFLRKKNVFDELKNVYITQVSLIYVLLQKFLYFFLYFFFL